MRGIFLHLKYLVFSTIFASQAFANPPSISSFGGNQDSFNRDHLKRSISDYESKKNILSEDPEFDPMAPSCAKKLILAAAKKNVADNFDNSPSSGGVCAYGVRTSLQLSTVGEVTEGLGNAIDYLLSLPPHGFVESGWREVRTAPPGSVLVFDGPNTASYLKDGEFGSPPGDWLGHVAIKGDDGFYYTDGRTAEAAIGWSNDRNVGKKRNLVGIFVPGPDLVEKFKDKCKF